MKTTKNLVLTKKQWDNIWKKFNKYIGDKRKLDRLLWWNSKSKLERIINYELRRKIS